MAIIRDIKYDQIIHSNPAVINPNAGDKSHAPNEISPAPINRIIKTIIFSIRHPFFRKLIL